MQRSWALWFIKMHCFLEIITSRYFGIFQLIHYCILISRGSPVSPPDFNFTSTVVHMAYSSYSNHGLKVIVSVVSSVVSFSNHTDCLLKVTTEGEGGAGRATALGFKASG